MRARFVYRILNEDYASYSELKRLVDDVDNAFDRMWKKDPKMKFLDSGDQDIFLLSDLAKTDKYPVLKDFIKAGVGLVKDPQMKNGEYYGPETYEKNVEDPEERKFFYENYPAGLVFWPVYRDELLHELQHAYDMWRSGGKANDPRQKYDHKSALSGDPNKHFNPDNKETTKYFRNQR